MVSTRCKTNNLLNHIKQKKLQHNLSFNFCKDRTNKNYLLWETEFIFDGVTYKGVGTSKKKSISNFMNLAESDVFTYLRNVKNN